ncbi:SDR family NAD(P)-dependent oxidoreductase [Kribbia dieselivorans]|uniref:SDR family NAD(P)-dependent oxidoreductase n=1 Tax=Kribbia dieselivorans TaxID=331526 RepID=UPI001C3F42C9|nr:SDR family NAD(P)-dependent oxidoreductase [Kribbia dieselivorans]
MTNMFDLTGNKALVTGGGSGIGLAMAEALANAGATVTIWGRSQSRLDAALETLKATGAQVFAQTVDVTDSAAVRTAMDETVDLMGGLDTVVANAGVSGRGAAMIDATDEDHRRVQATNVDGVYFTIREAGRHMVERAKAGQPGGSIITIASMAAIEGAGRNASYGASKGAVVAMSNAAAVELARYGIRVNSVLPGWVETPLTEVSQTNDKFTEHVISRVPLGKRWGKAAEFGGIAVYLASDASSFQTGSKVVIDGGYSIF